MRYSRRMLRRSKKLAGKRCVTLLHENFAGEFHIHGTDEECEIWFCTPHGVYWFIPLRMYHKVLGCSDWTEVVNMVRGEGNSVKAD